MGRIRNSLGPLVGYHGCDRATAEKVLNNKTHLKESDNSYDWLGPGIYFWVDSPERGYDWAVSQSTRNGSRIKDPYIVGAFIHPGLCLNLTDYGVMDEIKGAFDIFQNLSEVAGSPLPENKRQDEGVFLQRHLDCAVIKTVHQLRTEGKEAPYDTVRSIRRGKAAFQRLRVPRKNPCATGS